MASIIKFIGALLGVLLAYAPRRGRAAIQTAGMVGFAVVLAVLYAARTMIIG